MSVGRVNHRRSFPFSHEGRFGPFLAAADSGSFMVRSAIGSAILALGLMGGAVGAQPALDPAGTWLTEDGRAKIRVERCGEANDKLCGFVVWMADPLNEKGQPRTDLQNPDPAKRNRPSLGMEIMSGLTAEEGSHFAGEIYNADDGKMYKVTLSVETPAELHVRGCVMRILCGSQNWARVADIVLPTQAKLVATAAKPGKPIVSATKPHDTQSQPTH